MKTFNKKGDQGETSLLYGVRVAKSDPHCEAYGTIDEAVSALGLARHFCRQRTQDIVLSLQKDLFLLGAEMATPAESYSKLVARGSVVTASMVQRLEGLIDELEGEVNMPQAFVLPGACTASAALDLARSIIRRAERRAVALKEEGGLENEEVLRYLNRLADLVYTLARYEEGEARLYV